LSKDRTEHIPENQSFMINYRVENIEALVEQLSQEGVIIVDEITSYDYGKFVHIIDEDGLTIELWEPNDEVFETYISGLTR
jgi:predicted enzyme related to lactoylglutathione lyase